jgi:hypothetical protein
VDLLPRAALALFISPIHLTISVELSAASLDIEFISRRKDLTLLKNGISFPVHVGEFC